MERRTNRFPGIVGETLDRVMNENNAPEDNMVSHQEPLHTEGEETQPGMNDGMISHAEPLHTESEMPTDAPGDVLSDVSMTDDESVEDEPRMTEERLREAEKTLLKYKEAKDNIDNRIKENEEWWRLHHWRYVDGATRNETDPLPTSGWLLNAIDGKHADIMDNYPEPSILPREESDKPVALVLSSIVPAILERNDFESTYSDAGWYKLKHGTSIYGVFWDNNITGLGDINIKLVDALNLFWEPTITDIQDSQNVFSVAMMDEDVVKELYPDIPIKGKSSGLDVTHYHAESNIDRTDKLAVIDWYYKKDGLLHYCKFCNLTVIYASEDDPEYRDRGYYDHQKYPFVFDTMYPNAESPFGFGVIDRGKSAQESIDRLNQAIEKNAVEQSRKRWFIRNSGEVNEEEFADAKKDFIHVTSNQLGEDSIREIVTRPLNNIYVNILQNKIEELKETTGNRDFSQGGTASGVTAASAIAALQESGSKLSRDLNKASYRSFKKIVEMVIELIRQFYDEPRVFRIIGDNGEEDFLPFDNRMMRPGEEVPAYGMEGGTQNGMPMPMQMDITQPIREREPVFDVKVRAHKSNPFSRLSQNAMAQEFYQAGFFNPQLSDQALACLHMMDFEGKDEVEREIQKNGTMYEQIQQLVQLIQSMKAAMGLGTTEPQENAVGNSPSPSGGGEMASISSDPMGNAVDSTRTNGVVERARERAMSGSQVK